MRFDPSTTGRTAGDLINSSTEQELTSIFRKFGEERGASRLAKGIVRERTKGMIRTTTQLREIVETIVAPPHRNKSLARIFQALRIAVNGELDELERLLPKIPALLNEGGRFAVLSYHSLEDRMIKRFIQQEAKGCICPPKLPACVCGKHATLRPVIKKSETADAAEIATNPRARSARLRVAERIAA
jgi:16S rRNA (cytosine1402-N4)-methyltransferase